MLALSDIAEEECKHLEHFASLLMDQLRAQFGRDATDQTVLQRMNAYHRRRGKKLSDEKKLLPWDGYLDPGNDVNTWKSHPLTTKDNLSTSDT